MKEVPGPKGQPVIGSLLEWRKGQIPFLMKMAHDYEEIARYRLGPLTVYQLNQPELIQEVLVTQAEKFQKAPLDKQIFKPSLGSGLLVSDGDFHHRQRRLMQPAFHSKRIENYAQVMTDYTQRMLATWHSGDSIDIREQMTELTMRIVTKTLYSVEMTHDADKIGHAMEAITRNGEQQYRQGFVFPRWLPVNQNREISGAVKTIDAALLPIIEERRRSGIDNGDLLSMLLLAQDEEGQMSDEQVQDEVTTLFAAGHETTSNALVWTWYLLSRHPHVEQKLREELDRVLGGRTPELHDLRNLPYLDYVLRESMRLYPPAWILNGRVPQEDVTIGDYMLPKGAVVFISPFVLHHDPRYFEQPEAFMPERWDNDLEKRIPRYAYFPFGGGPRVCIGNSFALMEARLVLATIAQRYRLLATSSQEVEMDAQITLRPKGQLLMRAEAQPIRANAQPELVTVS
ncbi:MAG: cytochrome P450 [Anaerolineae bacterium]|nr:cytochrome P450 [Anaerolineae bacterium]